MAKKIDVPSYCPNCGSNLGGIRKPRCPVCGWHIASLEQPRGTTSQSQEEIEDLREIQAERIAGILGVVLWIIGAALVAWPVLTGHPTRTYLSFRVLGYGAIFSLPPLYLEYRQGEPVNRLLLGIGVLWLLVGIAIIWLSR
jgi:hypothetical protein